MNHNHYPQDFRKRRVILILDPIQLEECEYEDNASEILYNKSLCILSDDADIDNTPIQDIAETGALLIQNPFNKENYIPAEQATYIAATEKMLILSNLCGYLGAKEVIILNSKSDEHSSLENGAAKAGAIIKGMKAGYTNNSKYISTFSAQIKDKFNSENLILDTEKARQYLQKKGLGSDPIMNNLIEARESPNPIKEREFTIDFHEEISKNIDIFLKASLPSFLKLKANYSKILGSVTRESITFKVYF